MTRGSQPPDNVDHSAIFHGHRQTEERRELTAREEVFSGYSRRRGSGGGGSRTGQWETPRPHWESDRRLVFTPTPPHSLPAGPNRKNEWAPSSDSQRPLRRRRVKFKTVGLQSKPGRGFSLSCCRCPAHLVGMVSIRKGLREEAAARLHALGLPPARFGCELRGLGGSNNRKPRVLNFPAV